MNFSKTAITFLVYDSMFVNSYCTASLLWNFGFAYISQISLSDSSTTQWVFNVNSQSNTYRIKFEILM